MLEKIGHPSFKFLSRPDASVLKYLTQIIRSKPNPVYYEIGIGIGATVLAVAEILKNSGEIIVFSRQQDVLELTQDLLMRGFHNINSDWGSPGNVYSGYHFELAWGLFNNSLPLFDLAYVDGGHVFHLDAPAACVLKELCLPGGLLLFDDYNWSLAKSPSLNPEKRPATLLEYDQRQIEAKHVQMVCKTLMDTDSRFELLGIENDTAVYRRLAP